MELETARQFKGHVVQPPHGEWTTFVCTYEEPVSYFGFGFGTFQVSLCVEHVDLTDVTLEREKERNEKGT